MRRVSLYRCFIFITAVFFLASCGKKTDLTEETIPEVTEDIIEETPAEIVEDIPVSAPEVIQDTRNQPLRSYFPSIHDENFAEIMPMFDVLMSPFVFFAHSVGADAATLEAYGIPASGTVETAADWEARRAEILDLLMYYYYGYKWQTTAENVTVNTQNRPENNGVINITVNETLLDGTAVSATGDVAASVFLPLLDIN